MDIIKEELDSLNAILKIKVTPEDYASKVEGELKKIRKNANLPGFRAGHVPMGVIKKSYGQKVLADELNKILQESLYNYITENKLDVLGNPLPKETEEKGNFENPDNFEFIYELGLAPAFEVKISGKDKVEYNTIKIDDTLLNKEVENLAKRYGKLSTAEKVGETDMVLGSFAQLDVDGNLLEGGITSEGTITVEFLTDEAAKKSLLGKKAGDIVVVDPKAVSKGTDDLSKMLNISNEDAEAIATNFNFAIKEVKALEAAELNEELFKKLYGEETEVKTEADLRAKLKADMESVFEKDSDNLFKKAVSDKLIKKLDLKLPDTFLKKWIKASNDKEITEEQLEKEYPAYSKSLQNQLIENKIIKENEIKVTNDEVIDKTVELMKAQFAQYGMPVNFSDEEMKDQAKQVLGNQEEAKKIFQMAYDDKLTAFYKDTVKIDTKEVSQEEFVKLFYAE